jgi:hypothetical protein
VLGRWPQRQWESTHRKVVHDTILDLARRYHIGVSHVIVGVVIRSGHLVPDIDEAKPSVVRISIRSGRNVCRWERRLGDR